MKKALLTIYAGFLLIGCGTQPHQEPPILEIYTKENIYFVDIQSLTIANELNDDIRTFTDPAEFVNYLGEQTAQDVYLHECSDDTHRECDSKCICDGLECGDIEHL